MLFSCLEVVLIAVLLLATCRGPGRVCHHRLCARVNTAVIYSLIPNLSQTLVTCNRLTLLRSSPFVLVLDDSIEMPNKTKHQFPFLSLTNTTLYVALDSISDALPNGSNRFHSLLLLLHLL
jgi:hypothetical protein